MPEQPDITVIAVVIVFVVIRTKRMNENDTRLALHWLLGCHGFVPGKPTCQRELSEFALLAQCLRILKEDEDTVAGDLNQRLGQAGQRSDGVRLACTERAERGRVEANEESAQWCVTE